MSKDIRSFFKTINGSSTSKKNEQQKEVKAKGAKKRVHAIIDSDDDDDLIITKQTLKKQKESAVAQRDKIVLSNKKTSAKDQQNTDDPKPTPIDLENFFGKTPVQQKPQTLLKPSEKKLDKNVEETKSKNTKKKKASRTKGHEETLWKENHSDVEFDATLLLLDDEEWGVTEVIKSPQVSKAKEITESKETDKKTEVKNTPETKKEVKNTPETKAEVKNTPEKKTEVKNATPVGREPQQQPTTSWDSDRKRKTTEAYQRYLNRGGARNPGSKSIPKGTPTCLQGKTFVVTGVLECMEREEAVDLIKKCGGRITSTVSKKTSYIVLGDEAGASKTDKANKLNTKQLTEDGLLQLIRELSGEDHESSLDIIPNSQPERESKYFADKSSKRRLDLSACSSEESSRHVMKADKYTSSGGGFFNQKETDNISKFSKQQDNRASSSRKGGFAYDKTKELPTASSTASSTTQETHVHTSHKKQKLKEISADSFYGTTVSTTTQDTHLHKTPPHKKPKRESQEDMRFSSGIGSSVASSPASDNMKEQDIVQAGKSILSVNVGDSLWVDKYKPRSTKNIIGQTGDKSNVKKLTKWLENWHKNQVKGAKKGGRPAPWAKADDGAYFKAALLSGPPGVGKTTSVQLVCRELRLDTVEFNASDTRSKRLLKEEVAELLSTTSIRGFLGDDKGRHHVLVMDEVDGMAGNEDRGGVQELIQLIRHSKVPVICMCNDRSHPKMRSLVNYCYDLRFNRPRVEQIKAAMMSVCFKEGIKIAPEALIDIISSANQDVRQVLHNLSLWAVKNKSLTVEQAKLDSEMAKKHLKLGPWDVARQVFSASSHSNMSLRDKEDLFFQDYSIGPLFVQDTYLHVKPQRANGNKQKTLGLLAEAADCISLGDMVEKQIRSQNAWGLLPVQAIMSSVLPGHIMEGYVQGQIQFPVWLGKNSKKNRMDRLLQELQVHMRLSATGSKQAVNLDYLSHLLDAIVRPLSEEGVAGVPRTLQVLMDYHLTREDLDSLSELCQWPGSKEILSNIEPKVKAALTRAYNKEGKLNPYASTAPVKKKSGEAEGEYEDNDEDQSQLTDEAEDGDDVAADAMIKKGKVKKEKAAGQKSCKEEEVKKGRGREKKRK